MHFRAKELLGELSDDTLERDVELEIRAHVANCSRCRTRLHELQLTEELLRRIPPSIIQIEPSRGAYVRLAALARWTESEEISDPAGWRLSMVGATTAVLIVLMAASAGSWAPLVGGSLVSSVTMESMPLDYAHIATNYR